MAAQTILPKRGPDTRTREMRGRHPSLQNTARLGLKEEKWKEQRKKSDSWPSVDFVPFSKLAPDLPLGGCECYQVASPYLVRLQNPGVKCSWPGMQQQVSVWADGIHRGILPRLKSRPVDEVVCLKAQAGVLPEQRPSRGLGGEEPALKLLETKMLRTNVCN